VRGCGVGGGSRRDETFWTHEGARLDGPSWPYSEMRGGRGGSEEEAIESEW
jgi:hypothetical protein